MSPYFHYVVEPDDQIEMRGPIGGPFTWRAKPDTKLLLVGGGSGVVPLMSMLRHRAASRIGDLRDGKCGTARECAGLASLFVSN